jgi:hypothetical protein
MKNAKEIAVVLVVTILVGVSLVLCLNWWSGKIEWRYLEVVPPLEVYWSKFLYHPEAWNEIFKNVSSITEFWNATVPLGLAGRSIPQIAQIFGAKVYVNDPEYAACQIRVPKVSCQALNETLAHLGFYVKNASYVTVGFLFP